MAETPGLLPTINEGTRIKTDVGTLARWGAVIGSILISGTVFYVKADEAQALSRENAGELKEIRKEINDLRYDLFRVGAVSRPPPTRGQ